MKNIKLALISILASTTLYTSAHARGTETHGGDQVAREFIALAQNIVRTFPYLRTDHLTTEQLLALESAVKNTRVITKDSVEVNGFEVDAINIPAEHRIEVNRNRWMARPYLEKNKLQSLVLHEYLWISGVDDTNYIYTNALLPDIEAANTRWLKTPIARGLRQAVCVGIMTRDHALIDQALEMGADLDGDCGTVPETINCPNSGASTSGLDDSNLRRGPIGIAIKELGSENICGFAPGSTADTDHEMIGIIKKLLSYRPNLNRPFGSVIRENYVQMAFMKRAFVVLELFAKYGADPEEIFENAFFTAWFPNGIQVPESLLRQSMMQGFNVNKPKKVLNVSPKPKVNPLISAMLVTSKNVPLAFMDFLVKNHKIDFCLVSTDPRLFWNQDKVGNMIDDKYLAIVQKYNEPCVPKN